MTFYFDKQEELDTNGSHTQTEDNETQITPNDNSNNETETDASATTSSVASHQHQQEQEILSNFNVPKPPVSTQQSSFAVENDQTVQSQGTSGTPRTLWMGDLDPWLDENAIADLWWQILHKRVTVKIIKPKNARHEFNYQGLSHSGYCFVEFDTFEDAQQALTLNGKLLPDIAMPSQRKYPNNPDNQKKYFRLNWASGATLSAPIVQTPEYSLFVGDLSASTTEAHLLTFFQQSFPHSIKTVRVMTDPVSGKSRCFGFVRFTEESERQRALVEMNGTWFGGRPLRVALATPRNNKGKSMNQNIHNYYEGDQQEMMYLHHPPQPPPPGLNSPYGMYVNSQIPPHSAGQIHVEGQIGVDPRDSEHGYGISVPPHLESPGNVTGQQYSDPRNTTVFVGGLSSEVTESTLFALFKPFGSIHQIKIPLGKNCGFIKYSAREEAEDAIASMQGYLIGGNRVRLSWGRVSMNNKKFQQQQMAQAAQLQAAAAMSMGLDPASAMAVAAAAAAGYPPPMPGQIGGLPPMSMSPYQHNIPNPAAYDDKDSDNGANEDSNAQNTGGPVAPPFYMPMPPVDYNVPHQDDLINSMSGLSLNNYKMGGRSENYMGQGYMMPPIYNGRYSGDMPYVPGHYKQSTNDSEQGYDSGDNSNQEHTDDAVESEKSG